MKVYWRSFSTFFISGTLLLSSWANASDFKFARGEYNFFVQLAKETTERFPADQYYYVGLGRSPTVLIALLQIAGLGASNLPASGMKWIRWEMDKFQNEETVFAHLNKFLPPPVSLGAKKLLVIDYVESGLGLKHSQEVLADYLSMYDPGRVVETLAIMSNGRGNQDRTHVLDQGHHAIAFKNPAQVLRFAENKYRDVAEYEGIRLDLFSATETFTGIPRFRYGMLKKILQGLRPPLMHCEDAL